MSDIPQDLGPYKIEREIGRGGMGVVYMARDTQLNRVVAIKTLPEHLQGDPTRMERFEREARALAQLNHPNVAGIYGVEEHEGNRHLVLEYVEGDTLAERLDRGAIPLDEALEFAIGIAAGVEAAHDAGVIHRDLKPANIKITPDGQPKVLDFGLARADESSSLTSSESATKTTPIGHSPTIPGAILGTAAYMSPEQARGRPVDRRTDIWSFAVVLYEMLTGIGPFHGESVSDSIGALLHKDVDFDLLPRGTPTAVRNLLSRCLVRDKNSRYRDIGDVRIELERARTEPEPEAARTARGLPAGLWVALAVVAALAGAAAMWWLKPEAKQETLHVAIPIPEHLQIADFRLSPDGRRIFFHAWEKGAEEDSVQAIHMRDLSSPEFTKLPGTETPFLIGVASAGDRLFLVAPEEVQAHFQVKSVAVAGGPVSTLYEVTQSGPLTPVIVSVGEEVLVLGKDQRTIYRARVGGGTPELVVEFDLPEGDALIRAAAPTRGGRFIVGDVWSGTTTLSLHRFDLKTGEVRPLVSDASSPRLFDTGHLAFQRDGTLWVAPFDLERGKLTGEPQPRLSGFVQVDFDRAGRNLVYLPTAPDETRRSLRLLDSSGETVKTLVDMVDVYLIDASVSPDGRRLAYRVVSGEDEASSRVWVLDILSGLSRPITPEQDYIEGPIWTPDGRIAYSRAIGSGVIIFLAMDPIPGAQPDVLLSRAPEGVSIESFSPDGRHMLVGHTPTDGGESGIYVADVGDDESRRPFFATSAVEGGATFRPDGEWVAYYTNPKGRDEIYLRPFVPDDPESAPIYPVTTNGGYNPQWSSDGRTLYYAALGNVYAVTVVAEPELSISEPRLVLTGVGGAGYSVTPDGQFVVMIEPEGAFETAREIRLILNWNLGETD